MRKNCHKLNEMPYLDLQMQVLVSAMLVLCKKIFHRLFCEDVKNVDCPKELASCNTMISYFYLITDIRHVQF